MKPSNRDWVGDESQYQCSCHQCRQTFFGHKHRIVCRTCLQQHMANDLANTLNMLEHYGFVAVVNPTVTPLQPTGGGHTVEVRPARGHYHPSEMLADILLTTHTRKET